MRLKRWLVLAAAVGLFSPATIRAELKVPAMFSDNMVVQRGVAFPVWGTAKPGEEIYVQFEQKTSDGKREEGKAVIADKDGKWLVKIGPFETGEAGVLTIRAPNLKNPPKGKSPLVQVVCKNVLVGEVWICSGQSNMQWTVQQSTNAADNIKAANFPKIRLFSVPRRATPAPQSNVEAKWVECSPATVGNFSAVGYYFGRDLHQKLNVPIGLIDSSYGGTPAESWTSRDALKAEDSLKYFVENLDERVKKSDPEKSKALYEEALAQWKVQADEAKKNNKQIPKQPSLPPVPGSFANDPSGLYNAMIAPLVPFAIKGAIWYQGESNAPRAYEYRTLFPAMIEDWRHQWKQGDFPFLLVQLAPYFDGNSDGVRYAELRDAQLYSTTKLKNVAMAVITDVGDEKDIHPKQKEPVGGRLAIAARALAYGEKIEYSGPTYKSKSIDGNKVILTFDHVGGGLLAKGEKPLGFAIAGEDGKFVPAEAVIQGDQVIVSSPMVEKPANVRYGWKNFMTVNLWNKAGLPASPFRTDDTPYTTILKK
jgi:sialate O-acetylesterase